MTRLSVLDQSPIRNGVTAADAVRETQPVPSVEEAENYPYSERERTIVEHNRGRTRSELASTSSAGAMTSTNSWWSPYATGWKRGCAPMSCSPRSLGCNRGKRDTEDRGY